MDRDEFIGLLQAHLEAEEPECRWCFAIDMQRVKGKVIAQHNFPDAMVLHLSCPRCGGEYSYCAEVWDSDYLKRIISRLHPESGDTIDERLFNKINARVFPDHISR